MGGIVACPMCRRIKLIDMGVKVMSKKKDGGYSNMLDLAETLLQEVKNGEVSAVAVVTVSKEDQSNGYGYSILSGHRAKQPLLAGIVMVQLDLASTMLATSIEDMREPK